VGRTNEVTYTSLLFDGPRYGYRNSGSEYVNQLIERFSNGCEVMPTLFELCARLEVNHVKTVSPDEAWDRIKDTTGYIRNPDSQDSEFKNLKKFAGLFIYQESYALHKNRLCYRNK
jgi:hypothetical protein